MYHALLMPEVQACLFSAIKEDEQTGRCTLAMIARTCSVLGEASIDALWSDLDGLRPLARCIYTANTTPLSDEACLPYISTTFQAEPLLVPQRTPESNDNMQTDFSVFYKYARRVRTLDLSGQRRFLRRNSRHLSAADDFFAVICYAVPSPILPNLRRLTWAPGMSLNWLRHFLNPQLRSLNISNYRGSTESSLFALDRIPGLCPKIKSLTLQIIPLDGDSQQELAQSCISRVICSWGELEELDYNPMTREDILRLHGLSSLRILRLLLDSYPSPNLPPDSLPFPLLHTLQIKADTLETVIIFMGAVKSSPKSVAIHVYASGVFRRETWSPELFRVFLDLVSRESSSRYQLQDFSVNFPYVLRADPVNVSDMLRPLFLCSELRILRIYMTLRFILGDGDLRMMAAAWPRLEKLELIDSRPHVTLSGGFSHPNQAPHPPPPMPLPGSVQATQLQPPQPPPVTTQVNPHTLPAPPLNPGQPNQFLHLVILTPFQH